MKTCPQCSTGYPDSFTICPIRGVRSSKIRKGKRTGWLLALMIGAAVLTALSQQEEGPILLPKPKPVAKPVAMLLVTCDLACDWKLDGEAKGRIDAGGSSKAKVELGQHLVVASTDDGLDRYETDLKLNRIEQTVIQVKLAPIRSTRLQKEELVGKEDEIARNAEERDRKDKDELVKGYWVDPETGLMWAKKDNGYDVTWQQASDYCKNLQLANHSDWRLASIDELQGIYDPNILKGIYDPNKNPHIRGMHVKGNLRLDGWYWGSSPANTSEKALAFFFGWGGTNFNKLDESFNGRALCVRRPRE
jgi:hypothetical protein